MCVFVCVFILPAGRHAMLLQCANIYTRTGHSDTKYNTKYNYFGRGMLRDTLWRFAKVNHALTTQLSIIITGFTCNVYEYFKDDTNSLLQLETKPQFITLVDILLNSYPTPIQQSRGEHHLVTHSKVRPIKLHHHIKQKK